MNYLTLLLKLVKSSPKLLPTVLRMLADALEANPELADEVIAALQKAKS